MKEKNKNLTNSYLSFKLTDYYLSFKLGNEEFAWHVNKVINLLELTKITEIPKVPTYVKGVINLRGMVLPVIDTRMRFGLSETKHTYKTCIVVMELEMDGQSVFVGALVDEVLAVLEIDDDQIKPPPGIGNKYQSKFVEGTTKVDDKFIMILNMENVFSFEEFEELKDIKEKNTEKEVANS